MSRSVEPVARPSRIEKKSDSLYEVKLGNDVVEFGDAKEAEFKPIIRLTRWNQEASFTVRFSDVGILSKTVSLSNGKLSWSTPDVDVVFYKQPITTQWELGGIEFEIILKEKPTNNIIDLPLSLVNLDLSYQPPLTEELNPLEYDIITDTEAWKDGELIIERPENVVGSYAVYHTSKKGNQYKAGKAFHIFRPQAFDADGNSVWCSLQLLNGNLRITIPQKALDLATYPITIDPTFGKTVKGGTKNATIAADIMWGCKFTLPANGDITSITAYLDRVGAGVGTNAKCAIYSDNAGAPNALQGGTNQAVVAAGYNDWKQFDFAAPLSLNAGTFWLMCWADLAVQGIYYDAGGANQFARLFKVYDGWPDPFGVPGIYENNEYSIYATYTVPSAEDPFDTGGVAPIPTVPRRRRYKAVIPMTVTVRRPYNATIPMNRLIRAKYQATLRMERLIRRRFTESFVQKRLIITKDFKKLLRTVHEYLKEEYA